VGDLKDPRLMYLKAWLFLLAGVLAAGGILMERPSLRIALLLGVAVWSFCRLYYFLFYVIERYIDPGQRFAGVWAALRYAARGRSARGAGPRRSVGSPR
jgi:hypothetical protein